MIFTTTSLHDTTLVHICNRFTCPSSYSKGQEHRLQQVRRNRSYTLEIFLFQTVINTQEQPYDWKQSGATISWINWMTKSTRAITALCSHWNPRDHFPLIPAGRASHAPPTYHRISSAEQKSMFSAAVTEEINTIVFAVSVSHWHTKLLVCCRSSKPLHLTLGSHVP